MEGQAVVAEWLMQAVLESQYVVKFILTWVRSPPTASKTSL